VRTTLVAVFSLGVVSLAGCNSPRTPPDAGRSDAGVSDAAVVDASGFDASAVDASSLDASTRDSGARDASADASARDGGRDAGARDVGVDASSDAAFVDGGPLGTLIQCAPPVPAGPSAGISFSSNFWSGFPFQLTGSGGHITRIGTQITPDGAGTIFGALVRLTGPGDMPDDPSIAGADVVMRNVIPVPASGGVPVVVSGALDVVLPPGWYAIVFGTGAFGGTATGNIPSGGGAGCISSPGSGYPFTIRQSDGMFILQGAEPNFFVEVAP
jgi:hypothetical protein